ncbi:MAG: M20/M25/M40 family metallo-hydrolase [bacterium]
MQKVLSGLWIVLSCLLAACSASKNTARIADDKIPAAEKYRLEIGALAQNAAIEQAFQEIERLEPQTHSDLILLTEIPSPPFKEEKRARKFSEMLEAAGADSVWIDAAGNVLALRRGTAGNRTVALDGHLDTVFPEGTDVRVKTRGDTLFAPGVGDDTRGLMVVLTVLRALEKANIQTQADVLLVGTVGEEGLGDLRGVKHLFENNAPKIDAWIAVDGGGLARLVNQALGSHRYRITFRGPGGHSWGAFGLANPQHALGRAIHYFALSAEKFTASGPRTSFSVGRIGGGTSINAIPFDAWMEVDMRSVSIARLQGIDDLLQQAVQRALREENAVRRDGPALTVEVKMVGDRPSGALDPSLPLIQRAIAATQHFGTEPSLGTGSTDSNIPISLGIPAVTIGRGGQGSGGHSLHEWWLNKDGHLAIQRALLMLVAEAGLGE